MTGSISTSASSGDADFAAALRGAHRRGVLYVTATKRAGRWQYDVLEVAIDGRSDRIDLLK